MQKSLCRIFSRFPGSSVIFPRSLSRHGISSCVEHHKFLNIFSQFMWIRLGASFWSVWQIRACHVPDLIRQ